tara:strand:- start:549 stop:674 length:126 start_codon:yes stop_codon:yes gene_type:complete
LIAHLANPAVIEYLQEPMKLALDFAVAVCSGDVYEPKVQIN